MKNITSLQDAVNAITNAIDCRDLNKLDQIEAHLPSILLPLGDRPAANNLISSARVSINHHAQLNDQLQGCKTVIRAISTLAK